MKLFEVDLLSNDFNNFNVKYVVAKDITEAKKKAEEFKSNSYVSVSEVKVDGYNITVRKARKV